MESAVLGLAASVASTGSGVLRFTDTWRASSTRGVSAGFAWLGLVASYAYVLFGVLGGVVFQVPPAVVFCAAFAYVVWRVHREPRPQGRNALLAAVAVVLVTVAGWGEPDAYGFIAGGLLLVASVPQAIRVWRWRSAAGVGVWAWLSNLVLAGLWCGYGVWEARAALWLPNLLAAVLAFVVLAGIWRANTHGPVTLGTS